MYAPDGPMAGPASNVGSALSSGLGAPMLSPALLELIQRLMAQRGIQLPPHGHPIIQPAPAPAPLPDRHMGLGPNVDEGAPPSDGIITQNSTPIQQLLTRAGGTDNLHLSLKHGRVGPLRPTPRSAMPIRHAAEHVGGSLHTSPADVRVELLRRLFRAAIAGR